MNNDQESPEVSNANSGVNQRERKPKAEWELTSNEKFWRDELMKHGAGSIVAFILICGYLLSLPEDIDNSVNNMPVVRLVARCVTIWVAGSVVIFMGVRHGIRIRCTKFNDSAYEYDTVFPEKTVRKFFRFLGVLAYLFLAIPATFNWAAHNKICGIGKCVAWLAPLLCIAPILYVSFQRWDSEPENECDRPHGEKAGPSDGP